MLTVTVQNKLFNLICALRLPMDQHIQAVAGCRKINGDKARELTNRLENGQDDFRLPWVLAELTAAGASDEQKLDEIKHIVTYVQNREADAGCADTDDMVAAYMNIAEIVFP